MESLPFQHHLSPFLRLLLALRYPDTIVSMDDNGAASIFFQLLSEESDITSPLLKLVENLINSYFEISSSFSAETPPDFSIVINYPSFSCSYDLGHDIFVKLLLSLPDKNEKNVLETIIILQKRFKFGFDMSILQHIFLSAPYSISIDYFEFFLYALYISLTAQTDNAPFPSLFVLLQQAIYRVRSDDLSSLIISLGRIFSYYIRKEPGPEIQDELADTLMQGRFQKTLINFRTFNTSDGEKLVDFLDLIETSLTAVGIRSDRLFCQILNCLQIVNDCSYDSIRKRMWIFVHNIIRITDTIDTELVFSYLASISRYDELALFYFIPILRIVILHATDISDEASDFIAMMLGISCDGLNVIERILFSLNEFLDCEPGLETHHNGEFRFFPKAKSICIPTLHILDDIHFPRLRKIPTIANSGYKDSG